MHLARDLLGTPANAPRIQLASSHAGAARDAPPAELAVVRSALHAARGERDEPRAALGGVDEAGLDATFRLLALETRLRIAASDEERQAVARAARAFDAGALADDDRERLEALADRRGSSR